MLYILEFQAAVSLPTPQEQTIVLGNKEYHFSLCESQMGVFCKYFLEKVASCFSIVLQLHFPQCCKLSFPAKGERESLQAYVAEVD
jgi:hypothetical protein